MSSGRDAALPGVQKYAIIATRRCVLILGVGFVLVGMRAWGFQVSTTPLCSGMIVRDNLVAAGCDIQSSSTSRVDVSPDRNCVAPTRSRGMETREEGRFRERGKNRGDFVKSVVGIGAGLAAGTYRPQEAQALFEDVRKPGGCPTYKAVPDFDVDTYMGIWYELAYHDWTQSSICGCTRFNMTLIDDKVLDAFTTACPYDHEAPQTYMINMRETIDSAAPGSFKEYAFYNKWDNKVVAIWRSKDERGAATYERAIQMQCVEVLGRRAFVGINFLSRAPLVAPTVLEEMFSEARRLGIAAVGGNAAEMVIVPHRGCRYPSSTEHTAMSHCMGSALGVYKVSS